MQHPTFGTGEEVPAVKAGKIDGYHAAKLLRKAITGMIPRQLIVDTLYGGVASPGIISFPPANVYFNLNLKSPAFDPVKAASYLQATGFAASIADIPPITVTPPSGTVSPTITVPGGTITGTTITASVTVPGGGTGTTLTSITVPTAGQITAPTAQSKTFSTGYESIMGNAYLGLGIGFVIGVIVFAVILMRKRKTV
jgi:ABC-type transport system substrate-binding protein